MHTRLFGSGGVKNFADRRTITPGGRQYSQCRLITREENHSPVVFGEPVRRIYANPPFLVLRRQKLFFNAHVLEYAALKKMLFPCQTRKIRILQIPLTPTIASLRSGESKEGDSTTCF
jgi:hypothetical protein